LAGTPALLQPTKHLLVAFSNPLQYHEYPNTQRILPTRFALVLGMVAIEELVDNQVTVILLDEI
jgi:hypothetical protein